MTNQNNIQSTAIDTELIPENIKNMSLVESSTLLMELERKFSANQQELEKLRTGMLLVAEQFNEEKTRIFSLANNTPTPKREYTVNQLANSPTTGYSTRKGQTRSDKTRLTMAAAIAISQALREGASVELAKQRGIEAAEEHAAKHRLKIPSRFNSIIEQRAKMHAARHEAR